MTSRFDSWRRSGSPPVGGALHLTSDTELGAEHLKSRAPCSVTVPRVREAPHPPPPGESGGRRERGEVGGGRGMGGGGVALTGTSPGF